MRRSPIRPLVDGGAFDDYAPLPDIGGGDDGDDYEEVATHTQRIAIPTGLDLVMDPENSEYTYFSDKHLQHWAGPSHWKFQRKAAGVSAVMRSTPRAY